MLNTIGNGLIGNTIGIGLILLVTLVTAVKKEGIDMENIRTNNQRNVPIQVFSYEIQTNRNHRSSLWEMCFLATEQLADSEDFNFFNYHYTFR